MKASWLDSQKPCTPAATRLTRLRLLLRPCRGPNFFLSAPMALLSLVSAFSSAYLPAHGCVTFRACTRCAASFRRAAQASVQTAAVQPIVQQKTVHEAASRRS